MSGSSYAFVDADNLARGLNELLKRSEVHRDHYGCFSVQHFLQSMGHKRVLVYSGVGLNDQLQPWINDIQNFDGFVVRTGKTTLKGKEVKQQGVDVKLAVDAMQHAMRENMEKCTIYSADGDFLPLIDALVEAGILVTVASFSNPNKGDVAPELRAKSDKYIHLTGTKTFNRFTSWQFGHQVAQGAIDLDRISEGYLKARRTLAFGAIEYPISHYSDGLRIFCSMDDDADDAEANKGMAFLFRCELQLKLWCQVVLPTLGLKVFWPKE